MRFLKAHKLFDGKDFLLPGKILVLDDQNLLKEIIEESEVDALKVEKFEGIITPGFVNAHCHLELSHMLNAIDSGKGFVNFGKSIMSKRNGFNRAEIISAMEKADKAMWEKGIVAVGDICNTADSFEVKKKSPVKYHSFIELIGLNPLHKDKIMQEGLNLLKELRAMELSGSLAPHAPYSVSKELINEIALHGETDGTPFTIHNQESEDENKFFQGEKSGFHDFYEFLKIDITWFVAPKSSSLQSYITGLGQQNALLVHNTFTNAADVDAASKKNIFWCFCPAANNYIDGRLPDFTLFKEKRDRLCLGTDSLASNYVLDLVTEANLVLEAAPFFSGKDMLRAMTSNGAAALHLQDSFGGFIPGKNAGLNLVSTENNKIKFLKKIV